MVTSEAQATLVDAFVREFGVWEEARPYLDWMVDAQEMALVARMQGRSMTSAGVAELMELPLDVASALLERAYSRHVLDRETEGGVTTYWASNFYRLMDHFARFGRWDDVPAEDRRRIDRRFLDQFIARHRRSVTRKMQGLAAENALPNDTVLLLHEAEAMVNAAEEIVVLPCDCRRLGQNCDLPVEVCLWFDDGARKALDRGVGRRLTRQEARELLRSADKKGLMHTGDASALLSTGSEWQTRGLHAICNCCACDCYPFRAAQKLGSKGVWPKSRYVAAYDPARCNLCGACVRRCHFGAFFHDGEAVVEGRIRKSVRYDPDRCWGCGLCASTCPSGAIVMAGVD
jgi:Pyruvate/2-oxoacid:ferredoxin oxidoreductase delta subunit